MTRLSGMKVIWLIFNLLLLKMTFIATVTGQEFQNRIVEKDIEYRIVNPQVSILISYAVLPGIGRIGTNHLLYTKNRHAFLFDSPDDNELAGKLYQFVKDTLRAEITCISVSHWHKDHSGGLDSLHVLGVKSYSYHKTKEYMDEVGLESALNTFQDSVIIDFEGTKILLAFLGAGHTRDNSVGWIADEKILFSGSVIRCMENTNLGYLKNADLNAWPHTARNIQKRFCNAILIIPGHGATGGTELFDHTIKLAEIATDN
jgi:metallo-beta-lactamase class B